jgi:hypothetical protein
MVSLDNLLHDSHIPPIKLINIDTYGAEFDIIQGAVSTLLDKQVPYVVCGIHPFGLQQMDTSEHELRQFMSYMGYEAYWIRSEAPYLVPYVADQEIASASDASMLFANTAFCNAPGAA